MDDMRKRLISGEYGDGSPEEKEENLKLMKENEDLTKKQELCISHNPAAVIFVMIFLCYSNTFAHLYDGINLKLFSFHFRFQSYNGNKSMSEQD